MKWRASGFNLALAVLTGIAAVLVIVLFPDGDPTLKVFAVIGVAASSALVAIVLYYALAKDSRRLALFAALRGWTLTATDPDLADRFNVFPMNAGLGGRVHNVVTGSHRFYEAATFTYVTARPAPQIYQITLIELDAALPTIELLPEDLVAAAKKMAGGQDVKVRDAKFDARWRIVAKDPDFVRDVFTPALRARLDERDVHGMPIAIDAGAILTWRAGPEAMRRLSNRLDVLIAVADAIPDSAWKRGRRWR